MSVDRFKAWGARACLLALLGAAGAPAAAQQADRERAQMLQMQQQLQRLQSDRAALEKERDDLRGKAQEAEKLRRESDSTGKALARARQQAAEQDRELTGVRGELATASEQLATGQAEIARLRKALADRDDALQAAALEKRRGDAAQALLAARLKAQTARTDLCEARHEGVMKFSAALIDRYESDRLRLCEPVTGIWKVRAESQIQDLREQLYGYRLDVPAPKPAAAAAPAQAAAGEAAASAPPAK